MERRIVFAVALTAVDDVPALTVPVGGTAVELKKTGATVCLIARPGLLKVVIQISDLALLTQRGFKSVGLFVIDTSILPPMTTMIIAQMLNNLELGSIHDESGKSA
ncbi:uncharacterized protein LOC119765443 [Culex quinquefasciatus]|uniref:uncharacterized protein LOC119765443 n=1 Tax=Culex quinquefasciatus TaxID=7176 RepID=UPI0018E2AC9B|nr:uncharacterized protein LOC119765443 [Culex quinquefasciatus]